MDKDESLALYAAGRDAWNRWAGEQLRERAELERAGAWLGDQEPSKWNRATKDWSKSALADFSGSTFREALNFNSFRFPWVARFRKAIFQEPASFAKAEFLGDAVFDQAEFAQDANFDGTLFRRAGSFRNVRFRGPLCLDMARFERSGTFSGTHFNGPCWIQATEFRGKSYFSNIIVADTAHFESTQFLGDTSFSGAVFIGQAFFENVLVAHIGTRIFYGAHLGSADLSSLFNLEQAHIEVANGSRKVKLPSGLQYPAHWTEREGDGGTDSSPPSGQEAPESQATAATSRVTPPADFEWQPAGVHPKLFPIPPAQRRAVRREVNSVVRASHLQAVARLAEDLLEDLRGYKDANRQSFVKDLSGPLKAVAREAGKPAHLVIASYLRAKLAVLESSTEGAEVEALDGVDKIGLRQLLHEGKKLMPFFPELAEIDDPRGANFIPEEAAGDADEFADRVVELVESVAGKDVFSEEAAEVVRAEREVLGALAISQEDRIAHQREKLARFGGLVGAINHALENAPKSVHTLGSFASIAAWAKDLWNVVRPFLGI